MAEELSATRLLATFLLSARGAISLIMTHGDERWLWLCDGQRDADYFWVSICTGTICA